VAVSTIVVPIVNCAPHAPVGQLIPAGTLVTEPAPLGPARVTVTTACVGLPPGQIGRVGSFTVKVAKPVTRFPPSFILAERFAIPQTLPGCGDTTPPVIWINCGTSVFHVTLLVRSRVSGGCI
jgi:hypothetical protein